MQISDERLQEFIRLYREERGEELTLEEGRGIAENLIRLYERVLRPLPPDRGGAGAEEPNS